MPKIVISNESRERTLNDLRIASYVLAAITHESPWVSIEKWSPWLHKQRNWKFNFEFNSRDDLYQQACTLFRIKDVDGISMEEFLPTYILLAQEFWEISDEELAADDPV